MVERRKPRFRGRGADWNPSNRFESLHYEHEADQDEVGEPAPTTQFLKDHSRSLITYNDSPDVGFDASINPYRGCEHGCIYCYARPTHEYIGYSAGLDFETKILVKEQAPDLLRSELSSSKWKPQVVAISGVTDPYQPIERKRELTRSCLAVFCEFRNPVTVVTKNYLVTRDLDYLTDLARDQAAAVFLSVTTLDRDLCRTLEPRTSHPLRRLAAIEKLSSAGVPTGVMVAPVIPGLTDHELPAVLAACAKAGAQFAGYITLRLPLTVAPLFEQWLTQHVPDRRNKVLNRIRSLRDGRLNDPCFGSRMRGQGIFADQVAEMFAISCRKLGIAERGPSLSIAAFHRPSNTQLELFSP
ncbi:MAG TPA: PA0069 family radical SAM protein [Terriglobia bacterium]|nr:PA0069 family radical SAM protein [Terriglobia bacterium]